MPINVEDMVGTFEYFLEIAATLFYAISGVRLAAVKKFDWFGAYTVGFITAIGGGTMRDVFLKCHPFWMLDPWYCIATFVGFILVVVMQRKLVKIEGTFYIFDAIGLGLFVDVGIYKSQRDLRHCMYWRWHHILAGGRDWWQHHLPTHVMRNIHHHSSLLCREA